MINLQDYIEDSRLFKTYAVDDLLFVEYKCLVKKDHSDIWSHNNYFAYTLGGKKKWMTQNLEHTLSSGEALFVKKGATTVYQYFDEPYFVLFVFIPDGFIRNMLKKYHQTISSSIYPQKKDYGIIPLEMNEVLASYFQSLFSYFLQSKPPTQELLRLKLEELILNIFTQPENKPLRAYLLSLGQSRKTDIKEIMETHFTSPLSISEFARMSGRSLSTFRRDFENIYHLPPGRWLTAKRLEYSRFLLESTDKSIKEVIYLSGFKNRSHFIRSFKESYGITPKKFGSRLKSAYAIS